MEYIEGSTLQEKWEEMEQDDKKNVCIKLGEQLRSLRSIPSPGYYGRAHHQPFLETAGFLMTREQEPLGPYDTYGDMVIAMADAAELQSALGTLEPEWSPKKQLIIDHLRNAYTTCEYTEAKFTHTDLKFDNIMLEPIIASQEHGKQEYKVVIIDWTRAAWYPAWVEAMDVLSQRPDRTIKSFAEELQPLPDMDIFRYYVAQGFEPFPHKDAVYFSQVMEELCMIL
ncbi:hypothetical protein EV356DRAFT_506253 [Viridothelium virens]|uniref:Aminoglycoside phosphotransferase domain-containing protein n=1 Tax=Viridothelium virens TaxID=1048519 RepID=A0A6A6H1Z8_VIRVR|nr:hypothetical protein EV356DRAFT_506253 [Viridothelium virens]